jgi:steroid 5-alpha reductase family enzyme
MALFTLGSLPSAALIAVGLQAGAWAHSWIGRATPTEHYYDLSGAATHLALVAHALAGARKGGGGGGISPRAAALAALSTVWAARLGYYLYSRVSRLGADERFTELKKRPATWAVPWTFQALWCFLLQAPLTVVARAAARGGALTPLDAAAAALALGGLALEAAADAHKDAAKRAAPGKPVMTGPFSLCVYPQYSSSRHVPQSFRV